MKKPKMHIYQDKEGDYLEIRFGELCPSHFEKIGPDTFVKNEEETGEPMGFAIFNVSKTEDIKSIDIEIPLSLLKTLISQYRKQKQ